MFRKAKNVMSRAAGGAKQKTVDSPVRRGFDGKKLFGQSVLEFKQISPFEMIRRKVSLVTAKKAVNILEK